MEKKCSNNDLSVKVNVKDEFDPVTFDSSFPTFPPDTDQMEIFFFSFNIFFLRHDYFVLGKKIMA